LVGIVCFWRRIGRRTGPDGDGFCLCLNRGAVAGDSDGAARGCAGCPVYRYADESRDGLQNLA